MVDSSDFIIIGTVRAKVLVWDNHPTNARSLACCGSCTAFPVTTDRDLALQRDIAIGAPIPGSYLSRGQL